MPTEDFVVRPQLTMLGREQCLRLHRASCDVLRRTGVTVHCPAGLELLKDGGAAIDGERVRISPSLVEWALASAPGGFNLYRRGSQKVALRLDGQECYFGTGSDTLRYLDPRTGSFREYTLSDLADCYRLCDALPQIDFVMSTGMPQDVPKAFFYRHQFATMLRHTTKPIVFVCGDRADIEAIATMAAAVAGGEEALAEGPNLLLYSEPSSPLRHTLEATEKLIFCAQHRIPVVHSPAPMMGGTAPITIAGALIQANAEVLSSMVMHQLARPGAPYLYGNGVHHLDMRDTISVYGAPEFQLARIMVAEMGRFYGLPTWGYAGHSDSKQLDGQAAADAQLSVTTALLAGTNLNHDVGYLESGLAASPEYMVLCNEIISLTRRLAQGVELDDEALALDVIHELGPGGDFLSHDHTLTNWRSFWMPQVFDRKRLEVWQKAGSPQLNSRLREITLNLMDSHQVAPLPPAVEQALESALA